MLTMQVASQKYECIRRWIELIIPNQPLNENTEGFVLLELLKLINGSKPNKCKETDELNYVLKALHDFYGINIESLLEPTKTGDGNYSFFGRCCLFLLVLAMGLRQNCKLFMSAAFQLPNAMHFDIVEMTRPLIDDLPVSLASFATLGEDSENQPVTPICRKPLPRAPLTCPVGPAVRSDTQPLSSPPERSHFTMSIVSPDHSFQRKRHARAPFLTVLESGAEPTDSPLYSLKKILDSPGVISKSHYLSKLEELRSLSAQHLALQDLYDETCRELQQLNAAHHDLELQHKQLEVKLKRRELELTEVKDELACARESHRAYDEMVQHSEGLRERLACALDELKLLASVNKENHQLQEEVTSLRSRVKTLEKSRPRLMDHQRLQQQVGLLKEQLRVADEKFLQLISEREESLSTTTVDQHQRSNGHSGCSDNTQHPKCSSRHVASGTLSPDSSQPGCCERIDGTSFDQMPSPILTPKPPAPDIFGPESLASVVAVNSRLHDLETALATCETDLRLTRAQVVRWQCRAIAAQAVSSRRGNNLRNLRSAYEDASHRLASQEAHFRDKLGGMEAQVATLQSRVQSIEECVQVCQLDQSESISTLSGQNKQLQLELERANAIAEQASSELTQQLQAAVEMEHAKDEEIKRLQAIINELQSEIVETKRSATEKMEHQKAVFELELNKVRVDLRGKVTACERLDAQLTEQLKANAVYRKAAEEENDRIRHEMSTLSTEHSAYVENLKHQYQSMQTKLNSQVELLQANFESTSKQCASLKASRDQLEKRLEEEVKKSDASLTLVASRDKELLELRSSNSEMTSRLNSKEKQLCKITSDLERLQATHCDLQSRLTESEVEKKALESRCSDLIDRLAKLESESLAMQERLRQQQKNVEFVQLDRNEMERRSTVLRDQLHQMESDWLHSQAQLAQTRSQLTQVEQALHETRRQLQQMEYSRAETSERLSRLESHGRRQKNRLVRSTTSLFSLPDTTCPMQTESSRMVEAGCAATNIDAHSSPIKRLDDNNASFTFISPLPVTCAASNQATEREPALQRRNVAIQKSASHEEYQQPMVQTSSTAMKWPPFADTTAPLTPEHLRKDPAFSAMSPEVHSRRFRRLLLDVNDEPLLSGLEQKSIPKSRKLLMAHKRTCTGAGVNRNSVAPSSNMQETVQKPAPSGDIQYIPETPLPWNALSKMLQPPAPGAGADQMQQTPTERTNSGSSVTIDLLSVNSDIIATLPLDASRKLSLPDSSGSHKASRKFWKLRKMQKRLKQKSSTIGESNPAGAPLAKSHSFSVFTSGKNK